MYKEPKSNNRHNDTPRDKPQAERVEHANLERPGAQAPAPSVTQPNADADAERRQQPRTVSARQGIRKFVETELPEEHEDGGNPGDEIRQGRRRPA